MLKAPKKEKRTYTHCGLRPTYVDLSRSDVYQLCYDLDDEGVRRFTGKIGERLLIERYEFDAENGKEFHSCVVFGIGQFRGECTNQEENDYQIRLWDEVRDQLYYINMCDENLPYCLRVIKAVKIRKPQKREKNDYITREEIQEARENIVDTITSIEYKEERLSKNTLQIEKIDNDSSVNQEQQECEENV
jgi:hypothetical protein